MMEEDVEIELLYKAHGHILMEAAATEDVENEERRSRICGEVSEEQQLINVKRAPNNKVPKAKFSRSKLRCKKKLVKRKYDSKKNHLVVHDESSTDVELLLDTQILSCFLNDKIKASHESDNEINTGFERNNESEICINKILGDELKLEERNSELIETLVERNCSRNYIDKCILELKSLQIMIDKREDLLVKLEMKLKEELIENESKFRKVREAKNALTQNETSKINKQPNLSKFCFKIFGMPYFHDSSDFPAPPNDDVKNKLKNDELILTDLPKIKYWRKASKDKLQDAIQLTLTNEKCDELVKEIEKLQCMLTNVSDEQTEREIINRISEFQKQLKRIRSMSYLELLASENPDREYDWLKYSASDLNGLHSPEECKRFWHLYLKPAINKSRWEKNEDEKLKEIAEKMNFEDWESIAQSLGTKRTAYQCLIHYRNRLFDDQQFSVGKWTKEEDEKLLNVINSSKIGDYIPWTKVSSFMSGRNHNQVYNRYINCINPKLIKGKFSREEDLLILSGIQVCGVTFKEMASLMNNRSLNQIRERYERHLLPKTAKTGTFSLEEDEQLLKLVDKHGERNFALVADEMKTRSRTQVRQRYNFIMQKMRTKPGWTPSQVKRRSVSKYSSDLTRTHIQVEKLRKEIESVEKSLKLTKLQSETFRIEKLKELRDSILVKKYEKKYDLTKFKKKISPKNSVINNQLLEFFKYYHLRDPVKSSVSKNSVDNSAYLNEIISLAKYFGHDLQIPTSEDEIWQNKHLNLKLKTFLIETLKQQAVNAASNNKKFTETSTIPVEEPDNIDYVEPEVDNTLIMEERWQNISVNVSNLNFSEFFKRTVFDYSNGMHKDIWDSKMKRSKSAIFNSVIDVITTKTGKQYFFPPNSITSLGFKSILLSRTRLKQDASKLFKDQVEIETQCSPTYRSKDKFQDTLLSLFYCPKVLSVTDIGSTLLPRPNTKRKTSTQNLTNREINVQLLNNSNQNILDSVGKVVKPIKDDTLQARKIKMHILEHNETRKRQLKEFKAGITFKRKMNVEHLAKNLKGSNKTSSNNQVKANKKLKKKKKEHDSSFKVKELINFSKTLKTNDSQNIIDSPKIRFDGVSSNVPFAKVPVQSYTRTLRSLKRRLDSDKYSEPANKKLSVAVAKTSKSNQPTSPDANNLCLKKLKD